MNAKSSLVAFVCTDPSRDPCGHAIYAELAAITSLWETPLVVDGQHVMRARTVNGVLVDVVRTADVVSHDYPKYLPLMNEHWAGCVAGLVLNWHQGDAAPDRIFPVHTTGDVTTGVFGAADPSITRGVLNAVESARIAEGLTEWRTTTEATHWSGIVHGGDPGLIVDFPIPMLDVEIGSSAPSWQDRTAARVIARAALDALSRREETISVLFVGGVHFEPTCREAALASPANITFTHILANHWVNNTSYSGEEGVRRIQAAVASVAGGVHALVFHDSLKGPVKQAVRDAAASLKVPAHVHRRLRDPGFDVRTGGSLVRI